MEYWKQILPWDEMQCILVWVMKIVHFILFFLFLSLSMVVPSLGPWLLSNACFLFVILLVRNSKLQYPRFVWVFLYAKLPTCSKNLNILGTRVLCRTFSYFLCHLFLGLMLFSFYHFNLFAGHNCRAHWFKFPALPIDWGGGAEFTIIIIL